MYEAGEDTGDTPGEYQYWVERAHLDRVLPFDAGFHHLRMNDQGVLAVLTGVGTAKAAATIMALGLDSRFDLTHAYWLVAGIAGGDPADVSLGSAVWVHWVVDGDIGYEIDAREIPPGWPTGYVPLRKSTPYEQPVTPPDGQVYELNPSLVDWAYTLTKNVPLTDTETMQAKRSHFEQAAALRPPVCDARATIFPRQPFGMARKWTSGRMPGFVITRVARATLSSRGWRIPARSSR